MNCPGAILFVRLLGDDSHRPHARLGRHRLGGEANGSPVAVSTQVCQPSLTGRDCDQTVSSRYSPAGSVNTPPSQVLVQWNGLAQV